VAIKNSKVHEPAAKATFSERRAGAECWDAGSAVSKAQAGPWRRRSRAGDESDAQPSSSPAARRMLSHGEKMMPGPLSSLPPPSIKK